MREPWFHPRTPRDPPLEITLQPVADIEALAERWRAMHARVGGSFFQSWCWTGCLGAERFADAVVLEAREVVLEAREIGVPEARGVGRVVALGLFNRRARTRWHGSGAHLGESGDTALDSVFIEHNGLLVDHPDRVAMVERCLRAAMRAGIAGRIVLAGVDDAHAAAAHACGTVRHRMTRPAPWLDLARARSHPSGGADGLLAGLSANTRYQLRRAQREYAAQGMVGQGMVAEGMVAEGRTGDPLRVERAATVELALAWLDALAGLHQLTWQARGKPGAFAEPAFRRFHQELVARGHANGQIDMLRITSGATVIGYLYNFVEGDRVYAYQSGFDYAAASGHRKPGLVCHFMAIGMYLDCGRASYDFLAGGDRYKTSLASNSRTMHWLEVARPRSIQGLSFKAEATLRRARGLAGQIAAGCRVIGGRC